MYRWVKRRCAFVLAVLCVWVLVPDASANAKSEILSVRNSSTSGQHIVVSPGARWKNKNFTLEVGVTAGKKTKWTRLQSANLNRSGTAIVCSSRSLSRGNILRLKVSGRTVATKRIAKQIRLSGCKSNPSVQVPSSVVVPVAEPPITSPPSSATTTIPLSDQTQTILRPQAPTSLALTSSSDTGDSSNDNITRAQTLVVSGRAEAGVSIRIYADGVISGDGCIASPSGDFECTLGLMSDGTKSVTAVAIRQGQESAPSNALAMTVDRTAPIASLSAQSMSLNSNESTTISISVSENTTTLTDSSIQLTCSFQGGCGKSNFVGSQRSYQFTFQMINNQLAGGALAIPAGSFRDIAGNSSVTSPSIAIGYDFSGPTATLARAGNVINVSFHEIPTGFSSSTLVISRWLNGANIETFSAGFGIINFSTRGSTGMEWEFSLDQSMWSQIDDPNDPVIIEIVVSPVTDVDGNPSTDYRWEVP